jgi:hypothetical protein
MESTLPTSGNLEKKSYFLLPWFRNKCCKLVDSYVSKHVVLCVDNENLYKSATVISELRKDMTFRHCKEATTYDIDDVSVFVFIVDTTGWYVRTPRINQTVQIKHGSIF